MRFATPGTQNPAKPVLFHFSTPLTTTHSFVIIPAMPYPTHSPHAQQTAQQLFHAGVVQLEQGNDAAAQTHFAHAVRLQPDLGEAWANLAYLAERRRDLSTALMLYLRAQAAGVDAFELHLNLGALFNAQGQLEKAQKCYAQALERDPASSAAWSNLGALQLGLKQDAAAKASLEKALALDPTNAKARFNLSYLFLRQGDFEQGWQCLESRDWYAPLAQHFMAPRWCGEPLAGKTIIASYEAGHGDTIQFARYVSVLKKRGARRIDLLCQGALTRLMRSLDGVDTVIGLDEMVPRTGWDYWTPLLSIPYHVQTRTDSIPAQLPYLHPDAQLVAHWAALLPAGGVRIGLVWRGNPNFENDAERSLPSLQMLTPLWQVAQGKNGEKVHFVSLQKGTGMDDVARYADCCPLYDAGPALTDFADSAALVGCLDLVIAVDTAIAHLAGALGTPCWVLLPDYMTDWRWRSEGSHCSWYPDNMRLFRQTRRGQWHDTIAELAQALVAFVHANPGTAAASKMPTPLTEQNT